MISLLPLRSRLMGLSTAISMVLLTQCAPAAHGQDSLPAKGEDTSKVLRDEKENKNRKAKNITDLNMIREKEIVLTEKLMNIASPDADVWYSPHLRDISKSIDRLPHAIARSMAHLTECPFEDTSIYLTLVQDENFKTCCVLAADAAKTEERIACDHPTGDGWAGLVEIFYPTTMFNWGNQRTETVLMTNQEVEQQLEKIDLMMEGEDAVAWVTKSNEILQKAIDKGGAEGGDSSKVRSTVQDVIKDVRPKDKKIRFSDGLEGEGLVVRPHFGTLADKFQEALARQYCLHPDQFKKIMTAQDTAQKIPEGAKGGKSEDIAKAIPPFCNFCQNGVALMTDQKETFKLKNVDKTPTDFIKGMQVYEQKGPGYCQMMHNRDNSYLTIDQRKVIEKAFGMDAPSETEAGYTCRNNGKSWVGMVPVTLYRTAQAARRAPEHMLPFLIAAGLYTTEKAGKDGQMIEGTKSYYKRFEPMPYFDIKGEPWQPKQGTVNERGMTCPRAVKGEKYGGKKVEDHAYLSDKTPEGEKGLPFVQQIIKDWNWFYPAWTKDGHTQFRGLNDQSQNYGAALKVMAMCPKGYVRWAGAPPACGREQFSANTP